MTSIRINLIAKDQQPTITAHPSRGWGHAFHQLLLLCLALFLTALAVYGIWLFAETDSNPMAALGCLSLGSLASLYLVRELVRYRKLMQLQAEALLKGQTLEVVVTHKSFRLLGLRPAWLVSSEGVIRGRRVHFEAGLCCAKMAKKIHKGDRALIRYLAHRPGTFIVLSPLND